MRQLLSALSDNRRWLAFQFADESRHQQVKIGVCIVSGSYYCLLRLDVVFLSFFFFFCFRLTFVNRSTMRPSAWFVASYALILCALRLIDAAKGQRQCGEVRDATVDEWELFLCIIHVRAFFFFFEMEATLEDKPTECVCGGCQRNAQTKYD